MIPGKRLRLTAWILFLSSVIAGGLLVWMSASVGEISNSLDTGPDSVAFSRLQATNAHVSSRWVGDKRGLEDLEGPSRSRRIPIQQPLHNVARVSHDEQLGGVRIFRRSGQALFNQKSASPRAQRVPPPPPHSNVHVLGRSVAKPFSFGTDVFVFLHIQKTGGTALELHLLDIKSELPCICDGVEYLYSADEDKNPKHCDCRRTRTSREQWLFSRFTFSWVCGVHADWTHLVDCVPKVFESRYGMRPRMFLIFTILRQPVERFLSEYEHVARGAKWEEHDYHQCRGQRKGLPSCMNVSKTKNMSQALESFLSCPWNLAINRQSRMLSNMSGLTDCYNETVAVPEFLFVSAQENLLRLSFFGLSEFQMHTQLLFEKTFGVHFKHQFQQRPLELMHAHKHNISNELRGRIAQVNHLDMYLYRFAKQLFLQRVQDLDV